MDQEVKELVLWPFLTHCYNTECIYSPKGATYTLRNTRPSYHHQWCSWGKRWSLHWDLWGMSSCPGSDSWPADTDWSHWGFWSLQQCDSPAQQNNFPSSSCRSLHLAARSGCRSRRSGTVLALGPEPAQARPHNRPPADRTRPQAWSCLQPHKFFPRKAQRKTDFLGKNRAWLILPENRDTLPGALVLSCDNLPALPTFRCNEL